MTADAADGGSESLPSAKESKSIRDISLAFRNAVRRPRKRRGEPLGLGKICFYSTHPKSTRQNFTQQLTLEIDFAFPRRAGGPVGLFFSLLQEALFTGSHRDMAGKHMLALLLVAALLPAAALPIAPNGPGDSRGSPVLVKSASAGREDAGVDGAFGFDFLHLVQVRPSAAVSG